MLMRWQSLLLVTFLAAGVVACAPSRVNPGDDPQSVRVVTVVPGMVYESNSEVARAETVLAMAEEAGAKQSAPKALGDAYKNLEHARSAYAFAEEEGDTDPEDELQVIALRHAHKALADAELALAGARAANDEAKVVKLQRSIQALRAEIQRLSDVQAGVISQEAE